MNILILSLAYAPYSGVGAARMTSLSKCLIDKGCGVTVICYNSHIFGVNEQKREVPNGVKCICVEKLSDKGKNRRMLEQIVEKTIREEKFDICISSVGPYDTMFFVHKIKKKWKLPYIIDYRDPWLFEKTTIKPAGILKYKLLLHDYLYQPVEKRAIKNAAKVISVTKRCQEDMIRRYKIGKEKCDVIYNGYEDLPTEYEKYGNNEFVIAIAGKFASYNKDAAENFLSSCIAVKANANLKVLHVGIKEKSLEDKYPKVYCNVGEMNHKDTMKELAKANVLLVSYAHVSGLGTKIFDYVALNKPIIYVGVVPSELAEFIEQFENSYICANREQMDITLKEILKRENTFLTVKDVTVYSREKQNEVYYSLLQAICKSV